MGLVKNALVTGATDGIGRETARQLLEHGWRVFIHGRSESKAVEQAAALAREVHDARATPVWGDFKEMAQVVHLAHQVGVQSPVLDVLINNAGVYERRRRLTGEGLEMTMAVNHFAPFLLTQRLAHRLEQAGAARIVNVSSIAHQSASLDLNDLSFERRYDGYQAYAASKLANILFTVALAKRLAGTHVTVNALHPGVIGTKLLHAAFAIQGASVADGARTSVYLATSEAVSGLSGRYFVDCREARASRLASDEALAEKLWRVSEQTLAAFL